MALSRAKATKDELDARREQVRRYLRQGLRPREILELMRGEYDASQNPYKLLVYDIRVVRREDVKALQIVQPDEALAEYLGRQEELFRRLAMDAQTMEGMPKIKAAELAMAAAKDVARAKGVDRRILGEGRDLTVRPGGPGVAGEEEQGFDEFILTLRRSRGVDDGPGPEGPAE